MARSAIETVVTLNLHRFGPEAAKRKHIEIARKGLAEFMSRQEHKPAYRIEVDGRAATSEQQVKPYGVIVYRFLRLGQVGRFALATARELSPVGKSADDDHKGLYKKSWLLIADGAVVAESAIPEKAEQLILVNPVPYSRKIHVRGARLVGVPPGIVERVRQLVLRRYGGIVSANIEFLTLRGGYVLHGGAPLKRAAQDRRSSAFRAGREFLRARADTAAGKQLTYPALVITPKV